MMVKRSPLQIKQILSKLSTNLLAPKKFRLTLVHERPKIEPNTRMIKLTRYDPRERLNPNTEFEHIRTCLGLPNLTIETNPKDVQDHLIIHTLHMLIPISEMKHAPDYVKRLSSIGYNLIFDKGKYQLFVNKREPVYMDSSKDTSAITTTLQEDVLLRNLYSKHPGIQNTYQEKMLDANYTYTDAIEASPIVESQQARNFKVHPT